MAKLHPDQRRLIAVGLALLLDDAAIAGRLGIHPKLVREARRDGVGAEVALVLWAVRLGAVRCCEVQRLTGMSRGDLIPLATLMVANGLLCALDGEPWSVGWRAFPLLGIDPGAPPGPLPASAA